MLVRGLLKPGEQHGKVHLVLIGYDECNMPSNGSIRTGRVRLAVSGTGIQSYDSLMAEGSHPRGFDDQKERDVVAQIIDNDEPVVGRHFAINVSLEGQPYAPTGAIVLSTDRRLIMLTGKGNFRVKVNAQSFPYGSLKPGVGNSNGSVFGQTAYLSGFGDNAGRLYMLQFFTSDERHEFVSDVGGALGGWHIIHGKEN